MPFKFTHVCDLFGELEALYRRDPPLLPAALKHRRELATRNWFQQHRQSVDAESTDLVALLSTIFPARRTDRVYGLQPSRLSPLLARCFCLGSSRRADLERWKVAGCGTLPDCVERVQRQTPNAVPRVNPVTVEEVDAVFLVTASRSKCSNPDIRAVLESSATFAEAELRKVYCRLGPRDCKWLTALILKDLAPLEFDEHLVISLVHPLLPTLLKVRATVAAAVAALVDLGLRLPDQDTGLNIRQQHVDAIQTLLPLTGTLVGRPHFFFGRSIKYLTNAARGRCMALERKYDGEYCQIHIDLSSPRQQIKIYSKSGKDSTNDREGIHQTIRKALRLHQRERPFSKTAILEGELLVWCDQRQTILPFHKVRNHVRRSGRIIGTARDAPSPPSEHLMIMFYDVLRVDELGLIHKSYEVRRKALLDILTPIPGYAEVVGSEVIDFASRGCTLQLLDRLSQAFAKRWEGYVMKPVYEPYLRMPGASKTNFRSCWFKIKKDYISGLGDTIDMLIVGASYNAAELARLNSSNMPWTHFHIACIKKKAGIQSSSAKPIYRVVHILNNGLTTAAVKRLGHTLKFRANAENSKSSERLCDLEWPYDVIQNPPRGLVIFERPLVVEMKGFGFEVPSNESTFALRFPQIVKVKWEAEVSETVTFHELQDLALEATNVPPEDSLLEEVEHYRKLLEKSEIGPGNVPRWEDTDVTEASQAAYEGIVEVYADERNLPEDQTAAQRTTDKVDPIELQAQNLRPALVDLNNLQSSGTSSLQLVGKIPHGAEDYAAEIRRRLAHRKRGRLQASSPVSTATDDTTSVPTSPLSLPPLKRRCLEPEVAELQESAKAAPLSENCVSDKEEVLNADVPVLSSDCTSQHTSYDLTECVDKEQISPPAFRNQSSQRVSSLDQTPKWPVTNASSPPASRVFEDEGSYAKPPDLSSAILIPGPAVPRRILDRARSRFAATIFQDSNLCVSNLVHRKLVILVDTSGNVSDATWLWHCIKTLPLETHGPIFIWDWRVLFYVYIWEKEKNSAAWARKPRQTFVGRAEMQNKQATIVWADGTKVCLQHYSSKTGETDTGLTGVAVKASEESGSL